MSATALRARMRGALALLVLVGALVGIPAGLLLVAGNPLPSQIPTFADISDALSRPDTGQLFLSALVWVGWIAWAAFAVCVLVELGTQLRGVPAPRLPGLQVGQVAARGLVAAVIALFIISPAAAASADIGTSSSVATTSVSASVDSSTAPEDAVPAVAAPQQQTSTVSYEVGVGDSLWSIAENQLGDGGRWPEIAALNYGVPQAGGEALTDSHWVTPGWVLTLPAPEVPLSTEATSYTVQPGDTLEEIAAHELGDADRYVEIAAASADTVQPGGAQLTDPDQIGVGWTLTIPGNTAAPAPAPAPVPAPEPAPAPVPAPTSGPSASTTTTTPETAGAGQRAIPTDDAQDAASDAAFTDVDEGFPVRTVAGVGSLMAAGVLGLIATRRRAQQRRRQPGQSVPMPTGPAAHAEQELRATADPLSVETIDVALRTLALQCSRAGRPLPTVRAARLTSDQFDLYLAEPAQLPQPWAGTVDATVWTLPAEAADHLDGGPLADVPAPWPSLVTIGHDEEGGHVLLDLEYLGSLGITGADTTSTREVLAGLAIELATSRWADDLQVTVVGSYPDLEDTLQTGRIRYLPALGRLLDELADRAATDRETLLAGPGDLSTARSQGSDPDLWTPEIVLITTPLTDQQRGQLDNLLTHLPRVAIAAVNAGEPITGGWGLQVQDNTAVLAPIGLRLQPQRVDDQTYLQLLDVLGITSEEPEGTPHVSVEPTLQDLPTPGRLDDQTGPSDQADGAGADPADPAGLGIPADHTVHQVVLVDQEHVDRVGSADDVTTEDLARQPATEPSSLAREQATTSDVAHQDNGQAIEQVHVDETSSPVWDDVVEGPEATQDDDPATSPAVVDPEPAEHTHDDQTVPATDDELEVDQAQPGEVQPFPVSGPQVLLLGPVDITHASGPVEPSKRASLTELAAYLALNPGGDHEAIDAAIWPGRRVSLSARNTAVSKLRRWLGKTPDGSDYLPRYQASAGYHLEGVTTDWERWQQLLADGIDSAPTATLVQALDLVRGTPFGGVKARRYAWAEPLRQQMIADVVDASYELARRRLMEGRWREATQAAVVGLDVEPGLERLARIRILAAHSAGNQAEETKAINQLMAVIDDLGGDLEPATEQLLADLRDPHRTTRLTTAAL